MLLKQTLLAFFLTTILCSLTVLLDNDTRSLDWFLFALFISAISYGLPNAIFLVFIYWLKIGQFFLMKTKYMLAEIVLLFIIFLAVDRTVSLIPTKYRYYSTPTTYAQKFAFQEVAIIFYSFVILFVVILAIERIKRQRWKKHAT